jgi:hypothetical protein
MNLKRVHLLAAMLAIMLGSFATRAEATPITGGFSFTGNFKPVNGVTGKVTTLANATGLDFLALTGSTSTPGVAGQFLVNSASGTFASLVGTHGTIRDFSFAGLGSVKFPNLGVPLVNFQTLSNLTFTLTSIAAPLLQTSTFLVLSGQGTFQGGNYTATPFDFNFTGNAGGGTFSFSSSNTSQVPEPATLSVFGVGLLVAASRLKRRVSA